MRWRGWKCVIGREEKEREDKGGKTYRNGNLHHALRLVVRCQKLIVEEAARMCRTRTSNWLCSRRGASVCAWTERESTGCLGGLKRPSG